MPDTPISIADRSIWHPLRLTLKFLERLKIVVLMVLMVIVVLMVVANLMVVVLVVVEMEMEIVNISTRVDTGVGAPQG